MHIDKKVRTGFRRTNRELGNKLWTRQQRKLLIKNQGENNTELAPDESTLYY